MTITRLSGGLTPADGADPRTFPAIFNAAADVIDATAGSAIALGSAVASQGSAIDAIEAWDIDNLNDVDVTSPVAGQKLVFDGTNWVNLTGYVLVNTLYFTSSGTFSKGDYPWLRAIRVKCVGGGGGSAGAAATGAGEVSGGGGGGGGGYGESFITNISGLDASVTVTRGAGGAGGAAGATGGSTGGASSFGSVVSGGGGAGGGAGLNTAPVAAFGAGGTGGSGTGDLVVVGHGGTAFFAFATDRVYFGQGGGSFFGGSSAMATTNISTNAAAGPLYGVGARSAVNIPSSSARAGAAGGNGIVIVELYA